MTHRQRLLSGALAAANDEFRFRHNPEIRRIVGQIGEQRDESGVRHLLANALRQATIEMRNHGKHKVGGMLRPIVSAKYEQCANDAAEWCAEKESAEAE